MANQRGPEDHCTLGPSAQDPDVGKQREFLGVTHVMARDSRPRSLNKATWLIIFALILTACGESFTQPITENAFDPELFDPTDEDDVVLPEGYFLSLIHI